jgi:hypothetical protein
MDRHEMKRCDEEAQFGEVFGLFKTIRRQWFAAAEPVAAEVPLWSSPNEKRSVT